MTFEIAKQPAALQSYVRCARGLALPKSCLAGQVFFAKDRNCTSYIPATAGASRTAPAGCTSLKCACRGRADGIYTHPSDPARAIICSLQSAHPFDCPSGFVPQVDKGCASLNSTRPLNRTRNGNSTGVGRTGSAVSLAELLVRPPGVKEPPSITP